MNKGLMIATDSTNLNLNVDSRTLEACLKTINNFGSTVQQNICTGQSVSIPWEGLDWVIVIVIFAFALIILDFLIGILIDVLFRN